VELVFEEMRSSIFHQKIAKSRQIEGRVPDNNFGEEQDNISGLRKNLVSIGKIYLDKKLNPDFSLIIKEPGIFTAILKNLSEYFPTYAIIRNPLSVLASWNSVPFHVTKGRTPISRLDIALAQGLAKIKDKDKIEKQIYILSWFYEQYKTFLSEQSILRYENIVASGGKALSAIQSQATTLNESLQSKNINKLYDKKLMLVLGKKLLKSDGCFWEFYSKDSVELIIKDCLTNWE
jgi:ribosome-associated protein YbcJ (S4-like RNA binding protein)